MLQRYITTCLIACLALTFSHAITIQVCDHCQYDLLEPAISEARAFDTILIIGGIYQVENIVINKSLSIIGEDNATIESKNGDEIFTIVADSVNISSLIFRNVALNYLKELAAIRVLRRKHFSIINNQIYDCFYGIYLEKSNAGYIAGNEIQGDAISEAESGNGIHAWNCNDLIIENNIISNHRDGIYFEFVDRSTVRMNRSEQNLRYGLHFMFSNDDLYTRNTFSENGAGVAVMFSRRINMRENIFSYNWGSSSYGLLLKEIYDAEIEKNIFENNTIGIFVEGSNRIKYLKNRFNRNGWAIKFSGGCEDNEITRNNFMNNSLDLVVNAKLSSNKFHHNYWSNYSGYDLNKDGVGDVPHYPVRLFSYVLEQAPETIVLMRSFFVELINFSEKVSPVFTPKQVQDEFPLIEEVDD